MASPLALAAGIIGNIISLFVFLAPTTTFYRIYKKKSTQGFQVVPYVVALFSAMLWLYYAFIKTNEMLLIIINAMGVIIESLYIAIFLSYANNKARAYAAKLFLILDVGIFSIIVLLSFLLSKGEQRVIVVGWICVSFAVGVFAAPLSIMKLVITTRSVEFMPFHLSFYLTLCAVAWFLYGLLIKDIYVMLPNVLGFMFGSAQMILYMIYKKPKGITKEEKADPKKRIRSDKSVNLEAEIMNGGENKENVIGLPV